MAADPLEIEVKIRFEDVDEARRALKDAGAREIRARHFEDNRIFDTPGRDLAARSALLRVRETSDEKGFVTFKEKVESDISAKVRKELEAEVSPPATLAQILLGSGFIQTYRYQKYRTVFRLGAATIDLDETPMGCFIEIEGSREEIDEASRRMGRRPEQYIVEDYRSLYLEWLEQRGLPPGEMIFDPRGQEGASRA